MAELDEEECPEAVPDLKEEWTSDAVADLDEEEWPDTLPDMEEEWPDTLPDLVDLQERETADSVADFDEESADAVSMQQTNNSLAKAFKCNNKCDQDRN